MKKISLIVIILLVVVGVSAGSYFIFPYEPGNPPEANENGSTKEGVENVVDSNNKFSLDLYSKYKSKDSNVFFSPYSISSALAMTYEGAREETAKEIKDVFHFPEKEVLRPNYAAIYNDINKEDKSYKLRTGNALWAQEKYPFKEEYFENVENYYGGKAANLDFIDDSEGSRQKINDFIEEQTNNKIKDLIPKGSLGRMTRLVLTNAIYFNGNWEWEFDESKTTQKEFRTASGEEIMTPMMYMEPDEASFNYTDLGELQILEMPYKGRDVSMLILLPNETLDQVENNLTLENFNEWKNQMSETKLDEIHIPKFEFETKYSMSQDLEEMGMPSAFSNDADFSGMTEEEKLFISNVIHQAYVKVNEEGTEAAAATAVTMEATSIGPRKVFKADHPFIFMIQDNSSGNILFMGRVNNPKE